MKNFILGFAIAGFITLGFIWLLLQLRLQDENFELILIISLVLEIIAMMTGIFFIVRSQLKKKFVYSVPYMAVMELMFMLAICWITLTLNKLTDGTYLIVLYLGIGIAMFGVLLNEHLKSSR